MDNCNFVIFDAKSFFLFFLSISLYLFLWSVAAVAEQSLKNLFSFHLSRSWMIVQIKKFDAILEFRYFIFRTTYSRNSSIVIVCLQNYKPWLLVFTRGSGCCSDGLAVATDSRGPQFESSHWHKFISNVFSQLYWRDENKEKEAGNGPFIILVITRQGSLKIVKILVNFGAGPLVFQLALKDPGSNTTNLCNKVSKEVTKLFFVA